MKIKILKKSKLLEENTKINHKVAQDNDEGFRAFIEVNTGERKVKYLNQVPSKKLGSSDDIYNAIRFLISSDYTNGSVITIDGCME